MILPSDAKDDCEVGFGVNGGRKWGYVRYFLDLCVLILFTFR